MFVIRHALIRATKVEAKLCRNPNYGGKSCSVPGTCIIPLVKKARKPGLHAALLRSAQKEGFRNPITVHNVPMSGLLLGFGGSRLRVAQELDMLIPAIIMDHTGAFVHDERVTRANWQKFFTDVPVYYDFNELGFDYHYSLERARRETYDPGGFAWVDREDDKFLDEEFSWL